MIKHLKLACLITASAEPEDSRCDTGCSLAPHIHKSTTSGSLLHANLFFVKPSQCSDMCHNRIECVNKLTLLLISIFDISSALRWLAW